jgi:hypothetical protein
MPSVASATPATSPASHATSARAIAIGSIRWSS